MNFIFVCVGLFIFICFLSLLVNSRLYQRDFGVCYRQHKKAILLWKEDPLIISDGGCIGYEDLKKAIMVDWVANKLTLGQYITLLDLSYNAFREVYGYPAWEVFW
jgi:hypothetical protein